MLLGKSGRQHRWTKRPALVVMQTVLQFESGQRNSYVALEGEVSNADAQKMAVDLRDGLKVLTSGVYDAFASVSFERAKPGAMVDVDRDGVIVAGRFEDVMTRLKAAGFGGRVMKCDRHDHEWNRDPGRRVRSDGITPPPAPHPRARARARLQPRELAALDHEPDARERTDGPRPPRLHARLPAATPHSTDAP